MSNFCTFSQAKPNERDPFKIPAYPEYPKLRLGTNSMPSMNVFTVMDTVSANRGFRTLSPKCWLFSILDARGPNHFWQTSQLLNRAIDFIWFPVCVSSDYSTHKRLQCWHRRIAGMFCESMKSFSSDPDYCGIHPEAFGFTQLIGIMFGRMPVFSERLEALQFL